MKINHFKRTSLLAITLAFGICFSSLAYRTQRLLHTGSDMHSMLKYQIDTGQEISTTPASEALEESYLSGIFGDDPELLNELKSVVNKGLEEAPELQLGEVAAMVVTHTLSDSGEAEDVVVHVLGGFPSKKRKPGFHRDGYFRNLIDPKLWQAGNSVLSLLGRDMVVFAPENLKEKQQAMLSSLFSGEVTLLAEDIKENPLYFTLAIPNPKSLVPPQLRRHIQAIIVKGHLSKDDGKLETIILCPSIRSAKYAFAVIKDMKIASEVALKTKWQGIERPNPYFGCEGKTIIDPWWAYEMVNTSEKADLDRFHNIIKLKSEFGQVMCNAVLKSAERMSRDMFQIIGSLEQKKDPRQVDTELRSEKPTHYWSNPHRWGPYWPLGSGDQEAEYKPTNQAPLEPETSPESVQPATS